MELDSLQLDAARDAWRQGNTQLVQDTPISALTLGASLEVACWYHEGPNDVRELVEHWARSLPRLRQALNAFCSDEGLSRPGHHDAPAFELRCCPSKVELVDRECGVEWDYFLDRFRRSLIQNECCSATKALQICAGMREMVDNVVQHSGQGDHPVGCVAYQVGEGNFRFAVADLGQGVLASLRENPSNASVKSDGEALRSAVIHGASRRVASTGTGFADLQRALSDLEGCLTFRTGGARLIFDGRGASSRVVRLTNSPKMGGFQLEILGSPKKSTW